MSSRRRRKRRTVDIVVWYTESIQRDTIHTTSRDGLKAERTTGQRSVAAAMLLGWWWEWKASRACPANVSRCATCREYYWAEVGSMQIRLDVYIVANYR